MTEDANIVRSAAAYRGLLGFLMAVCTMAYVSHFNNMMFVNCDSPWHIAAGDLIRKLGHVPMQDPWAFTTQGQTWYNISWAYDVAISWINSLVGLDGLQLVVIALGCVLCGVLFYICKQRGVGIFAAFIATYVGCFMSVPGMQVRPQLVAMVLLAVGYVVLHEAVTKHRVKWLLTLPLLMVAWVNIHGSFTVMFVTIGAYGLGALLERNWRMCAALAATGLACGIATLFNPYGVGVYRFLYILMQDPLTQNWLSEWLQPKLSTAPHVYVYIVALMVMPYARLKGITFADKLLAIFWAIMTLQAIRHFSVLVIFITPLLAAALEQLRERYAVWRNKEQEYAQDLTTLKAVGISVAFLFAVWLVIGVPATRHLVARPVAADPATFPVHEIEYIKAHYKGERVFNHYGYGGLMIYMDADAPLIIDGRASTVYSIDTIREYLQLNAFQKDWQAILKKHNIRLAILPKYEDEKLKTPYIAGWYFAQAGWTLAFSGDVANVYEDRR